MADNDNQLDLTQFLQPSNDAPGSIPSTGQQDPTTNIVQALSNYQAAQAMPQGPPQNQTSQDQQTTPTFSTQNSPPYTGIGTMQDMDIQNASSLIKAMNPDNPENKAFMDRLNKTFSYTPEQRAQDLYDKMFGITRTKDEQGNVTGVHHNWGQFLMGMIGEALRGANEKGAYVPAMERMRQQALGQFQAEAVPLAKELQYKNLEERSLLGIAQRYMTSATQGAEVQGRINVAKQRNDIYAMINDPNNPVKDAERQALLSRVGVANSEIDLNKVRADLDKTVAQQRLVDTMNKELTGGQSGPEGFAARQAELRKQGRNIQADSEMRSYIAEQQLRNPGTFVQGPNGIAYNQRYNYQTNAGQGLPTPPTAIPGGNAPPVTSDGQNPVPSNQQTGNWQYAPGSQTPQSGPLSAAPQQSEQPARINGLVINPKLVAPPESHGLSLDAIHKPKDIYFGNANMGSGLTMPNTPPERNWQNDATLFIPSIGGKEASPQDITAASGAANLWALSQKFSDVLARTKSSSLGPIMGNLEKWALGKAPTDPNLNELYTTAHALAIAHLEAQRLRNGQLSTILADKIFQPGASKADMLAAVKGLEYQTHDAFNNYPQHKGMIARSIITAGGDYYDLERVIDPDQWKRDMTELQKQHLAKGKK